MEGDALGLDVASDGFAGEFAGVLVVGVGVLGEEVDVEAQLRQRGC